MEKTIVEFKDLPDEVKLPMIAAVGGSIVAAVNHFSDSFMRKSRRTDISVDKIEAEHQLDVWQAELIHRMVEQQLLQENSVFRIMEEEVKENKKTIRELLKERRQYHRTDPPHHPRRPLPRYLAHLACRRHQALDQIGRNC